MRGLLLALLLAGFVAHAKAQAPAPEAESLDRPGYREAFQAGLDEFGRGSYVEARARFAEAHTIWPNARTWRVLGYCAYELGDYAAAIDSLERALRSHERPLTDSMRSESEDVLRRARGYVAPITVITKPADASLQIDGAEASRTTLLAVGTHAIEARAPEYFPLRREIQVVASTPQTVTLELIAQTKLGQVDEPLRKKWWLWASVGTVAAAALVTGLVVGLHDPGTRGPTGGASKVEIAVGGMQ